MCSCDMDDGYSWDFRWSERRRARKPHECSECGSSILPGEVYVHNSGKFDGNRPESWSECVDCDAWAGAFCREQERSCGCSGYELGGLWDAILEHEREEGFGGPSLAERRAAESRKRAWLFVQEASR